MAGDRRADGTHLRQRTHVTCAVDHGQVSESTLTSRINAARHAIGDSGANLQDPTRQTR